MREMYYQAGPNPIRPDRLPDSRPELSLLARPESTAGSGSALTGLLLSVAVTFIPLVGYRAPGWSWLEPYDWIVAISVMVFFLSSWLQTQELQRLLHPAFLASVLLVFVQHRTPWLVQLALVGLGIALVVNAFGRHWVAICTASPFPRERAQQVQAITAENLQLLSLLTGVGVALLLWWSAPVVYWLIFALPLAALFIPLPAGLTQSRWQILGESLGSWFSYPSVPLPGLLQSPAGSVRDRWAGAIFLALLATLVLIRWEHSPLPNLLGWGFQQHQAIGGGADAVETATNFQTVRHLSLVWLVTILGVCTLAPVLAWVITLAATMPVLLYAAAQRAEQSGESPVTGILSNIQDSTDPTERTSVYLGRVVADSSPVLVPRKVFEEHAHGLGDSGAGKTALFLCPIIEQLVQGGECSVIVLDLKGDSLELLATLQAAAEKRARQGRTAPPLKVFSNQNNKATLAFNPLTQSYWENFDLLTRTDILCAANGLNYGSDYGAGYFTSANAAILYHTLKTFPHVRTFREVEDCIGNVIVNSKKRDLNPEIRKAGVHVQEVMKRLAACLPLNVTSESRYGPDVAANAIELTQFFQEPQLLFCHLPSTLSPSGAPEIGRLFTYMLLAAATQVERKHPVFLVIDEFQRMVASNLEYMLQLARSMGVGIILANQSLQDLQKGGTNLIPPIEANCRLRQWFSVSSSEDQERLIRISGETIDWKQSVSYARTLQGLQKESVSFSEVVVPRLTKNDILRTSDHPHQSILRISRGAGYAQYGGLPVIIESEFHISEEEYRRRRALPWPVLPGSFLPASFTASFSEAVTPGTLPAPSTSGPQWTNEVIETNPPAIPLAPGDDAALADLFATFEATQPPAADAAGAPKKRGRKRS